MVLPLLKNYKIPEKNLQPEVSEHCLYLATSTLNGFVLHCEFSKFAIMNIQR